MSKQALNDWAVMNLSMEDRGQKLTEPEPAPRGQPALTGAGSFLTGDLSYFGVGYPSCFHNSHIMPWRYHANIMPLQCIVEVYPESVSECCEQSGMLTSNCNVGSTCCPAPNILGPLLLHILVLNHASANEIADSWFPFMQVGSKNAAFFMGQSVKVTTKRADSPYVHELALVAAELEQRYKESKVGHGPARSCCVTAA